MNKKELGIYIHVPFCKSKCYYCDFVSFSNKINAVNAYINALKKDMEQFDVSNYNVTTIYIGGGTPSYIDEENIKQIFEILNKKLENNDTRIQDMEITIEINPGTATIEKLKTYKNLGINRISIGLQSTQDRLLKEIGRIHTYQEFLSTYKMARKVGFNNINVDLMIGLPTQNIEDIKQSLEEVVKLQPEHISVYSLIVEEGTVIEKRLNNEEIELPQEYVERRMYWYVKNYLELQGYLQYEISNFAKKGYSSKHNLNCWRQKEYIGFGVAAHSYIEDTRFGNIDNLEEYIKNIEENHLEKNRIIEEKQTKEDKEKEFMMLGFRKTEGISISEFKEKFIDNPLFVYHKELEKLVRQKLIEIDLDNIRLTSKGLDFANLVFEEFI